MITQEQLTEAGMRQPKKRFDDMTFVEKVASRYFFNPDHQMLRGAIVELAARLDALESRKPGRPKKDK